MEKQKPSNPRMHSPDGIHAAQARMEDYVSLRDYFAAKAMQAAVTALNMKEKYETSNELIEVLELLPRNAYWIADRMLEQREK